MVEIGRVQHKSKTKAPWVALLALLLVFPFIAANFGNSWVRLVDMALLYVMLALGLNLVVGFAGLLDLGYVAFYAVGAYVTALLASPQFAVLLESLINHYPVIGQFLIMLCGPEITSQGIHLSVWWTIPISALVAGLVGVLLGAPTLRLNGDYLAVVTLGFGEIVRIFINNLNSPVNITDGPKGINMIDPIRVFGVSFAGEPNTGAMVNFGLLKMPSVNAYYFLFLLLCILLWFVSLRLKQSRTGRALFAIREDELVAKAMGINTRNLKLTAFALGASFGGIAGSMFAVFQGFISPESFSLNESVAILAMVVLGGLGHVAGVIGGALLLAGLPELLRHIVEPLQRSVFGSIILDHEILRQLLLGLAMVSIMLVRPAGLWPSRS